MCIKKGFCFYTFGHIIWITYIITGVVSAFYDNGFCVCVLRMVMKIACKGHQKNTRPY